MQQKDMSFVDHIGELRKRLIIVAAWMLAAMIAGFFLAPFMISYLQDIPQAEEFPMNAFNLTDPLKVYVNFAFFTGLIMIFPIILYQIWAFISPGLLEKERKITLAYIPIAVILFLIGLSFSFFILFPFVIDFLSNLADQLGITEQYGVNEYFAFLFQLTVPFGFLFQLPVVIMFLTRLGLVTPDFLSRIRKYAYFVLLLIAGFITPPEIVSHLMVTVPLLLLYEISIIISRLTYKRMLKEEEKRQQELIESEQNQDES
ncbi:twin-arginine translocase subunit TatC [Salsuginibacillus kocurii]|uniref:twin-arginine translocase subunit TatC n=1 Tax=Salsuginibacillus kocurii TaxID=427078 RepID=UPI000369EB69|nr:twin-arginine translocase subunit TatC [Salsuginibacillus kocurii]